MASVSLTPPERARRIACTIRQRMNEGETQAAMAVAMGCSEATVNRLLTDHLDRFGLLLAHLGQKLVPADWKCVEPAAYEFLTSTHQRVMRTAPQLIWEREDQ